MSQDHTGDRSVADGRRRTVLRGLGAGAALTLLGGHAGLASADHHTQSSSAPPTGGVANIDPIFGKPYAGSNPCMGDAPADCVTEAHPSVTVDHEVEMLIDLDPIAGAAAGVLSDRTVESIMQATADGSVDRSLLNKPDAEIEIVGPNGPTTVTVEEVAESVVRSTGFHFEPAGLHVRPGETVLFSAESPDHAVAVYHEGHGRQNRVPDGVGPVSSPLIPVGGYWLQRFRRPGVYDYNCPPHEVFGMVGSIVVAGAEADAPPRSVEQTGRPPTGENLFMEVSRLAPNLPSAMEALTSEALSPDNIKAEGAVSWSAVVDEHQSGGDE